MRRKLIYVLLAVLTLMFASMGEAAETAKIAAEPEAVSDDSELVEDLTLREIDNKALELVKEFGAARDAVPPITGVAGSVVLRYSSYIPKIICRPMYVTDVILQQGEVVTDVHPGDAVRWAFVPSKSGTGDAEQIHVLIKPLAADISTNVVINTDRRTYLLDLMSSAKDFMPGQTHQSRKSMVSLN